MSLSRGRQWIVRIVALLLITFRLQIWAADTNWPQFRGPNASGIAEGFKAPTTWDVKTGKNIAWRVSVSGMAHSSPIVWGNRVYVATAVKAGKAELKVGLYGETDSIPEKEPHQWHVLAFDKATGKQVWDAVG